MREGGKGGRIEGEREINKKIYVSVNSSNKNNSDYALHLSFLGKRQQGSKQGRWEEEIKIYAVSECIYGGASPNAFICRRWERCQEDGTTREE